MWLDQLGSTRQLGSMDINGTYLLREGEQDNQRDNQNLFEHLLMKIIINTILLSRFKLANEEIILLIKYAINK
jgi:hypothetical protein